MHRDSNKKELKLAVEERQSSRVNRAVIKRQHLSGSRTGARGGLRFFIDVLITGCPGKEAGRTQGFGFQSGQVKKQGVGFGLRWDHETFPSLWFWQLYRGGTGYPWYGMNYTLALEPVSSYPQTLTEAIKTGSQIVLAAGEERSTRLLAVAFAGHAEVRGIDDEGSVY